MQEGQHTYIAIDLKSFYASVECADRSLDPLNTNLVVADPSRTEKTICLAVSPSLKSFGIGGRPRLFEVVQQVEKINIERLSHIKNGMFTGTSVFYPEIVNNPLVKLDYIVAKPQMSLYMKISASIYDIYLKYISPDDIHVYSVDEVFIDATHYLSTYDCTARELAMKLIRDVLENTGITATAGIGTNMYLCKVAMDIVAKKMPADKYGVRVAELDEESYRRELWDHRPITDFWRVGRGYAARLAKLGLFTMGDIAECSVAGDDAKCNEEMLYKTFGINAELLIDHAWGWEPCTIADIKGYTPESSSLSIGQVLKTSYNNVKGRLIISEMAEQLTIDLTRKKLLTNQLIITVGYDYNNIPEDYAGEMGYDFYGRTLPKTAHGSINLPVETDSSKLIVDYAVRLYDKITDRNLYIKRMYIVANNTAVEISKDASKEVTQCNFFSNAEAADKAVTHELATRIEKENSVQQAIVRIKEKYGKNAVIRGMNLINGATTIERNGQVGGHRA